MNCKGNELAVIKIPEGIQGRKEHNDKIIYITTLGKPHPNTGKPTWYYEGTRIEVSVDLISYSLESICDEYLRPIGNPPEDAVDETLLWKPVPTYDKPVEKEKEKV